MKRIVGSEAYNTSDQGWGDMINAANRTKESVRILAKRLAKMKDNPRYEQKQWLVTDTLDAALELIDRLDDLAY